MRNAYILLVVLMVLGVPTEPVAQDAAAKQDGNYLLPLCQAGVDAIGRTSKNELETFGAGYCLGLVKGVVSLSPDVCLGPDVTLSQSERVLVKFLQDNPEKLDRDEVGLAVMALSKAFPCSKR